MDSMETRRNAIVELINEHGTVSFAQIKKAFAPVSEMTLRTDLKILEFLISFNLSPKQILLDV